MLVEDLPDDPHMQAQSDVHELVGDLRPSVDLDGGGESQGHVGGGDLHGVDVALGREYRSAGLPFQTGCGRLDIEHLVLVLGHPLGDVPGVDPVVVEDGLLGGDAADLERLVGIVPVRRDVCEGESGAAQAGAGAEGVRIHENRVFADPRGVEGLQLADDYVLLAVHVRLLHAHPVPAPPERMVRDERGIQFYLGARRAGLGGSGLVQFAYLLGLLEVPLELDEGVVHVTGGHDPALAVEDDERRDLGTDGPVLVSGGDCQGPGELRDPAAGICEHAQHNAERIDNHV